MNKFLLVVLGLFGGVVFSAESALPIVSPCSLNLLAFAPEEYLQATSSGRLESAKFGMTRNSGTRFHEGIDIRSIKKSGNGFPRDLIFASMPGEVVYINRSAKASSYGRYIVLKHKNSGIELYTLYAHMASFSSKVELGQHVPAGTLLGMMGLTSSVYKIPKSDAHLHFEVGIQLGDAGFSSWFNRNYGPGNAHGIWNGFNLVGADPIAFLDKRDGNGELNFASWLDSLTRDFTVRISSNKVPEILKRSPKLFLGDITTLKRVEAWEIDFTWFGFPISFRPFEQALHKTSILNVNSAQASKAVRRGMLQKIGNEYFPGKSLNNYLEIIFGQ